MPKQMVDPMKKEVARGLKLTGKTAEYVSFKVPRKNEPDFSPDLFPYHRSQKAGMTSEQWTSGANYDPQLELFFPEIPREESKLQPSTSASLQALPKLEEQKVSEDPN